MRNVRCLVSNRRTLPWIKAIAAAVLVLVAGIVAWFIELPIGPTTHTQPLVQKFGFLTFLGALAIAVVVLLVQWWREWRIVRDFEEKYGNHEKRDAP
jgi:hypothetical protein